jgi:CRP-like cAMP-binding protein
MYYNTVPVEPATAEQHTKTAKSQDKNILDIAQELKEFAEFEMHRVFMQRYNPNVPRASITRALNTLQKHGKIAPTGRKKIGIYGRLVNIYEVL